MQAPPSTAEFIRFHARHRPAAIAVVDGDREVDYATFNGDVQRFTRALRELELPRGSFVAVAWDGFYLHWLLLLGCESLGYATASFLPGEGRALQPLMARAQLVLSAQDVPQASTARRLRLTPEWLAGVFGSPEVRGGAAALAEPLRPDEPQRIRRSSGTTGAMKMMVASRAYEERRVLDNILGAGFTPQSKLLVTTPFTVGVMYSYASACARLGASCIGPGPDLAVTAARPDLTHMRLFQFQIQPLLDALPAGFVKPADLTVMLGSAPVSDALRGKILQRLAARIVYLYSINETGTIATVGEDGLCTLRPGVRVEIVDGKGAPVPAGETGRIRVRGVDMVEGYLDDPETTARAFRDGWFQTGDAGSLESGKLRLAGRSDELLNIAGLKIDPARIEEAVARGAGVADVGATSMMNADGVEELCVAIVPGDTARAEAIRAEVEARVAQRFGAARVRVVGRIPRTTETGKIRRAELALLFAK